MSSYSSSRQSPKMSSRQSSQYSSRQSSRSASPRSSPSALSDNSFLSRFLNKLYQQKAFNLLLSLTILFFIIVLSFTCFEVKKTIVHQNCECAEDEYFNGEECVKLSNIDYDFKNLSARIKKDIHENLSIKNLKEVIPSVADLEEQILYAAIYQLHYFVNNEGEVNNCDVDESVVGYQITIIIFFIICAVLTIISYMGRKSRQ